MKNNNQILNQVVAKYPPLQSLLAEYNQYAEPYLKDSLAYIASINNFQTQLWLICVGVHCKIKLKKNGLYLDSCVYDPLAKQQGFKPRCTHQQCIETKYIYIFIKNLISNNVLSRTYSSFEDLYSEINKYRIKGKLGDLFVYDVSLRIGYIKNILPQKYVYLQCGALIGAKNLVKHGKIPYGSIKGRVIPASVFSSVFPGMSSMDIENFLCVAKAYL